MIAIPGIEDSFERVGRDTRGLSKRRLHVMRLTDRRAVQCLEVHCPPRLPILLRDNDYPVTPGGRRAHRNGFDNPQSHISIQIRLHTISPVDWDRYGGVDGCWNDVRFQNDLETVSVHHRQGCVFTCVKGTGGVPILDPGLKLINVLWNWITWKLIWDGRRARSHRTAAGTDGW